MLESNALLLWWQWTAWCILLLLCVCVQGYENRSSTGHAAVNLNEIQSDAHIFSRYGHGNIRSLFHLAVSWLWGLRNLASHSELLVYCQINFITHIPLSNACFWTFWAVFFAIMESVLTHKTSLFKLGILVCKVIMMIFDISKYFKVLEHSLRVCMALVFTDSKWF